MKKVLSILLVCFTGLFLFVSCASTPKAQVKPQERFYWTIEGTSKSGQPSYVHILGTIHMGDDRIYPLPETIMSDFNKSKRVVAEIGSDDIKELEVKMLKVMMESVVKAGGRDLSKELTEKEIAVVESQIGKQGFAMMRMMEPWLLTYTLASLQWSNSGLVPEKGVDTVLMGMLTEAGRKGEGLDTADFQLDILRFGTYDQQLFMLKDQISEIMDPSESDAYLVKMYDAYLKGDDEQLTGIIFAEEEAELKDLDVDTVKFLIEYNNLMVTKRNKAWAEKIKEWL